MLLASLYVLFRSPRPDFIETKVGPVGWLWRRPLFRSPRPDFIETGQGVGASKPSRQIVPVSKTGLH